MTLRKIHLDPYLKKFLYFCKKRYGDNLIAIGIYGSYVWGYFDKEKSDYDVFIIFSHKPKDKGEIPAKKFKKIALQYFCSSKDLLKLIKEGHWSLYITLLKSARMIYYSKGYKEFINKLERINFVRNLNDTERIEWKAKFDEKVIKKSKGYSGAKYAFPALRSRLQLLTYIKHKKLIWDLFKIIKLNKNILTNKEQKFLIQLDKSVKQRKDVFLNKKMAIVILNKINNNILAIFEPR